MKTIILHCIFIFIFISNTYSQCDQIGQSPFHAFPVCGYGKTTLPVTPSCGGAKIVLPRCQDLYVFNAYYYKFTCYKTGYFLFQINTTDNYDWVLYDVTNIPLSELYKHKEIVIAANFWRGKGVTGLSGQGGTSVACKEDTVGTGLSIFKDIFEGHHYILMVCHDSIYPDPYTISFDYGSTAVITDPVLPHLKTADAPCDGTLASIKLNRQIKCSSIAADGSDFEIVPHLANVIAARGIGCNEDFDTDSIHITLDAPLPAGTYSIVQKKGTDGNTILDDCDLEIPVGEKLPFSILPFAYTPLDSLTKLSCATDTLQFVFKKKMRCNSIATDGTDFIISGPTAVKIISAAGVDCDGDGLTKKVTVKLSGPIHHNGLYKITLVTGSDGNTIINECDIATSAGSAIDFYVKDTVNADFSFEKKYGCTTDTVNYFHNGNNVTNYWNWKFDDSVQSSINDPVIFYNVFGVKNTQLIVSNGVCSDTVSKTIPLNNLLHVSFEASKDICPSEKAFFKNTSSGDDILSWNWNYDNGNSSSLQQGIPQYYNVEQISRFAKVRLIAMNFLGCSDTAYQYINISNSCFISVPTAFTPNGDGINDYLYPLVAYKAKDLLFIVYNRFGQTVFQSRDWTKKWDGKFKGQPADPGTYVWILQYTDSNTGKKVEQKGTTILIR